MGNRRVTAQNLTVEQVDVERNLLMVRGAVPGARNTTVMVRYADSTKLADRLTAEEWAELMGTPVAEAEEVATDEAEAEPEAAVTEEAAAEEPPEAAAEAETEESGSEAEEGKAE